MFLKTNYKLTDKEAIKMGKRIRKRVNSIDMTEESIVEKLNKNQIDLTIKTPAIEDIRL